MCVCVWLHLPLALINLLPQVLQVGQEGLVEVGHLEILIKTCPQLSSSTTSAMWGHTAH